jgi:hypothetical protein
MQKTINIITVEGTEIRIVGEEGNENSYISLTDIAKRFGERPDQVISNWIRTRATLEFLGTWEVLQNSNLDFNSLNFEGIKKQAGTPTFVLSVTDWVAQVNAKGIYAKAGRYGGTYAHQEIALEFCSWISPVFKLYILKEFKRLKEDESLRYNLEWNVRRMIAKANYQIHSDSVKNYLIPQRLMRNKAAGLFYATEADLLNMAIFGMTAKQWRESNPNVVGNLRDNATIEQLLVLSNLESLNSELIKMGFSHDERLERLNETAISQMHILVQTSSLKLIP